MNTVIFFFLLVSGAAEDIPKHRDDQEEDCGVNLFCYINDNLLNTMNKLFTILTLDTNFTEISRVKLLLNMHDNLRSIAENNYKTYQDITNTSKVNYDNKTEKPLFNLTEAIEDFFHEEREFLSKNRTEVNHAHHENKDMILNNISCSLETNETAVDSVDSVEFLSDFLDKVDKLSFQDLLFSTKKLFKESSDSGYDKHRNKIVRTIKTYNLKPWKPENSSEDTRRIFKGKTTKIKRYPFVASFHMGGEFLCAGSIISKNMILSAASCLQIPYNYKNLQNNPNYLTVRIGSDFTNKMGDKIPVANIVFHPAYDPVNLQNNLAIARMQRPIVFQRRNKKIRRIEFDRQPGTVSEFGGVVSILGWGDKNKYDTNSYGDPISYAHLKVYPLQECKEIYSPRYVNEMHFCAGFKQAGTGACNRDVGGPGIVGSILVGVVSFGPPVCGTPDTPTVFTRLSYYTAWLDDVITNDQAQDAEQPTTWPPILREKEMLKVIVKELPITTTPGVVGYTLGVDVREPSTPKDVSKKLQILKNLFKELIRTGSIDMNELLNEQKEMAATGIERSAIAPPVDPNKILRDGKGMMLDDHTGVYSSTKAIPDDDAISFEGLADEHVERSKQAVDSVNYETQLINFEPDTNEEMGLSIEFMPRAKERQQPIHKQPLPPEVIHYDRDLRHVTKKKIKRNRHNNRKIDKQRRVKKIDRVTEVGIFAVDEDLNPIPTTKPTPAIVSVEAKEDTREETTTFKTYDADDSEGAKIEFEIIAGEPSFGDAKDKNTKKSLLEYVNLQ